MPATGWDTVAQWPWQHISPSAPTAPQLADLWVDSDATAGEDVDSGLGDLVARVDDLEEAPPAHAGSHAANGSDPVTPAAIGAADLAALNAKADTSAVTTALAGKANTAHTHSATDVTTGTLSAARLPTTTGVPVTESVATSTTLDAAVGSIRDLSCTTAALAIAVPTNPTNRQVLRVAVKRSTAAALTVNLNAAIRLSTGLTSRAFPLASGEVLLCALEYTVLIGSPGTWVLTAATTVSAA